MAVPEFTWAEVEALLKRVLGNNAHRVVDILQDADDYDAAIATMTAEFGLSSFEAQMVLNQQFKLLVEIKP
jgi:hypothetical protein